MQRKKKLSTKEHVMQQWWLDALSTFKLQLQFKGQRPHKGTENTMKITITAIHIKETLLKRKLKTKLLPQCFQRNLCWIISTRNYFVRTHIYTHANLWFPPSCFMKLMTPWFKFAKSHKNMSPSTPTWLFIAFFIMMNPWKFGE